MQNDFPKMSRNIESAFTCNENAIGEILAVLECFVTENVIN